MPAKEVEAFERRDSERLDRQGYRLVVAYDGTRYAGWQVQRNGDTIQGRIEAAAMTLFGEKISVQGAGRTDAGVHARGQVASFRASKLIQPATLMRAFNANLPNDIRVLDASLVPTGFHARFSAKAKEYRYQVVTAPVMDPFRCAYALHHPHHLELETMRELGETFVGRHDFLPLSSKAHRSTESTARTIVRLTIKKREDLVLITVRADGFLYKMVRTIVGALLQVGRGEVTVEEMKRYFLAGKRTHLVPTAPPQGLFLWKVWYRLM